jgi:NADPH2:quinone reductase
MKALLSQTTGGPETLILTDVPEPNDPGDGQILLRVKACAVNFPDLLVIEDKYQFKPPRPFAPGSEVSGIVEKVGANVPFKMGDRLLAHISHGGMVEKLLVPATRCTPIPDSVTFEEASSLCVTYGTSYHALKDRAKLRPGEKLLVLGASGGVGIAAIQLGRVMGARIFAAVSSEEKLATAKEHGAEAGIVYPTGNLDKDAARAMTESLKQLAGTDGMDVIYDPVGGDYAEPALRSIAWQGRYLVVGFPAGIPKIPLNLVLLKGCDVLGVFWGSFATRRPADAAGELRELVEFCATGAIKPLISSRFPLEKGGAAISALAGRKSVGKVIVIVDGASPA